MNTFNNYKLLISGSDDHNIKLWNITDLETGTQEATCIETLSKHTGPVICMELLANNQLATGSVDTSILVWDLNQLGVCSNELLGHWGTIECLCPYKNDQVISGSSDKTIKVWNLEASECRLTLLGHTDWITSLQVLNDGHLLSGAGLFSAIIWDLSSGAMLINLKGQHFINGNHHKLQILSNDTLIFGDDDFNIKLWDLKDSVEEYTVAEFILRHPTCSEQIISYANDHLRIYDLHKHFSGKKTHMDVVFTGHTDVVTSLAALDGFRLASGSADLTIRIWNLENGECLQKLIGHTNTVARVYAFGGDKLVSGSWDKTIRVWNIESGKCLKKLVGHTKSIVCIKLVD